MPITQKIEIKDPRYITIMCNEGLVTFKEEKEYSERIFKPD